MPKLWAETIEAHRSQLRDAVLETAARLVAEEGSRAVTMSQIATDTGIGRATLYKYFPDVDSILVAWHQRQVNAHLEELEAARSHASSPVEALRAVLETYAQIRHQMQHRNHHAELQGLLRRDEHLTEADDQLHRLIRDLISEAATTGAIRTDAHADELATYARSALMAAGQVKSRAAAKRIAAITMSGLSPSGR